jgi:hypothetical protein
MKANLAEQPRATMCRYRVPIPPCSPSPQRRPSLPPDDTPVRGRLNQDCGYFDAAVEHLGVSPSSPGRRRGEEGGAGPRSSTAASNLP